MKRKSQKHMLLRLPLTLGYCAFHTDKMSNLSFVGTWYYSRRINQAPEICLYYFFNRLYIPHVQISRFVFCRYRTPISENRPRDSNVGKLVDFHKFFLPHLRRFHSREPSMYQYRHDRTHLKNSFLAHSK
jgi:hypothetical protein